jgi:dihydrolipoamide dehydrogenase
VTDHAFDIVILGAGSGGYAAALRAAELGKTVALVEKDKVGGTCLHRGCIPTKALLHAAEIADNARESEAFGVRATFDSIDTEGVRRYREGIVAKKYKGLEGLVKARGITVVQGEGMLEPDRAVRVGADRYVGADVILATGSYSRTLPGLEIGGRILTSEQALELDVVPRSAIVLGGGVIGVEFASVWRSFGVDVTIVEALDHLVPVEDIALSKGLERAFRKRGIAYSLGVRFAGATQRADSVTVTLEDGKDI